MKLAMFTSSIDRSGKEEGFIVDWVEALAKEADELVVFVLRPQKTSLKAKNVRVYNLGQSQTKVGKLVLLFRWFWEEHQKKHLDGIFSHLYDFLGIAAGLLGKCFRVKSVIWYAWGLTLKRFTRAELALRLNDEIVTCSNEARERYQKAYRLHKPIHVLGHAIEIGRFATAQKERRKDVFTIGFIGRAIPEKNVETLLKAAAKVNIGKIAITIVLAGIDKNPQYLRQLKSQVRSIENPQHTFRFLTEVPYEKIAGILLSHDLYVHPTLVHSVDKAPLEAIAAGVPVLLSNVGYEELCKELPELLFDPHDIDELAEKIERVIANYPQFKQLQEPLQHKVRSSYSTQAFMKKLVSLFKNGKARDVRY